MLHRQSLGWFSNIAPAFAWGCAMLCVVLLQGCSPEYNWREVRPAGLGFQVMFPGTPGAAKREVVIDGQKLVMSMSAAQAAGHSFSVGVVQLSNDSLLNRERILAALRTQMLRNVGAAEPVSRPITVPVFDPQGRPSTPVAGVRIEARTDRQPNQLHGGFVARGDRVYQFLVIGQDPDLEQVQTFIDSFRLLE